MRIDEIITAVRVTGRISDSDADFTDARVRQELTDTQQAVFGPMIVQARAGAWLKQSDTTTTAERTRYRLPHRAMVGVGESIELVDSGDQSYEILGDQLVFDSAPSAGTTLRFTYYLRPSLLCEEQTAGLITAKDEDAGTVTVNVLPVNRVTTASIATGDLLDIVHSNGWHELAVVGSSCTISGTTITLPSTTDLTDVETGIAGIGSYVRSAGQSDWPCLPDDFHRCLANMTAARINRARGDFKRAKELEDESGGDLARFQDTLIPRIKDSRDVCVPRYGVFRNNARRQWVMG